MRPGAGQVRAACESARNIENTIEDMLAELESEMRRRPNSIELCNKVLQQRGCNRAAKDEHNSCVQAAISNLQPAVRPG